MCCDTSALPVVGLRQELADLVRGDGEGDAGRHLQRVDADHLAILGRRNVNVMAGDSDAFEYLWYRVTGA